MVGISIAFVGTDLLQFSSCDINGSIFTSDLIQKLRQICHCCRRELGFPGMKKEVLNVSWRFDTRPASRFGNRIWVCVDRL